MIILYINTKRLTWTLWHTSYKNKTSNKFLKKQRNEEA